MWLHSDLLTRDLTFNLWLIMLTVLILGLQARLGQLKLKWKSALKKNKKLLLKCPNYEVRNIVGHCIVGIIVEQAWLRSIVE